MSFESYYTLELKEPIEFGDTLIEELRFRKPRLKDMLDMPAGEVKLGDLIRIAARLTAHPPSVFDSMSTQDGIELAKTVDGLLGGGLPTGGSS
jgi:hypothetical protein